MNGRIYLPDIVAVAHERPPGYLEAILGAARPLPDGAWLEIDESELTRIRDRFGSGTQPPAGGCQGCGG